MTDSELCVECKQEPVVREGQYISWREMRLQKVCFTCWFWREKLQYADIPNSVRVDNVHYYLYPDIPKGEDLWFAGHGGRRFKIKFHDGREVTTHNLWCQGGIPAHFRDRLPNNAEFVEDPIRRDPFEDLQ